VLAPPGVESPEVLSGWRVLWRGEKGALLLPALLL